jgi:hypothetical protein
LTTLLILGRIKDVDAAGDHANPCRQRAVMRCAVDAPSEAGNHDEVLLAEIVRQAACKAAGCRGCIASADDCDRHSVQQVEIALGDQQWRRVLELRQQSRIEPLPKHEISRAELLYPHNLALGLAALEQPRRLAPALPRQLRNGIERRPCIAESPDQLAESDGTKSVGPDQPQPVDQFLIQAFALPMRGSVPLRKRRIFSRCFHSTSTAKPSSIGRSAECTIAAVIGALSAAVIPATDEIRIVRSRSIQIAA